jgi:4-amino-4-deoxy-L-arabinose transferase-like glycosyltransferase
VLLLSLILAAAMIFRIMSFCGFYGSDDGVYADLAFKMANGSYRITDYSSDPVFPLRLGVIVPAALGFKITGPNDWSLVWYPFVLSLAGIVLMFFAGQSLFSTRAGLLGAGLLALIPLDVRSASLLLPDLPAAFWAALGVFLLFSGTKRKVMSLKIVLGFFSGISFGLSWLCKESVLFLFPFLLICALWILRRREGNGVLLLTTGLTVLFFFVIEAGIYHSQTLDYMYRFHAIERNYDLNKEWFFSQGGSYGWAQGEYLASIIKRIFWRGPLTLFLNPSLGYVTGVALFVAVYAVLKKKRAFFIPGIWFVSLALMMNFSSSSLSSYRPLVLFDRYLYPLLFPSVLLTAGVISDLFSGWKKRTPKLPPHAILGGLLILCMSCGCLLGVYKAVDKGIGSPVEREVSRILSPQDRALTDSRTAWVLNFFWGYPQKVLTEDFEGMKSDEVPEGVFVLINRNRLNFLNRAYNYGVPEFVEDRPARWVLKWSGNGAALYWIQR